MHFRSASNLESVSGFYTPQSLQQTAAKHATVRYITTSSRARSGTLTRSHDQQKTLIDAVNLQTSKSAATLYLARVLVVQAAFCVQKNISCANSVGAPYNHSLTIASTVCSAHVIYLNALVIRRTVLHDLSVLAICRTMQINSRPTEIIIYFWKQWRFAWVMTHEFDYTQTTQESYG